jgi:PucR C-terminal helix-turn-helix domain
MHTQSDALRRIVERTNIEQFTDRLLESFWETPEFQERHPPREDVRALVRWNLDLMIRWLTEGRGPTEAELDSFRELARDRAADGTPADVVPANFRRGARFAWSALLEAATDEERPALLQSADLLFDYVDRVTRIFSEVYESASLQAPTSAEEAGARALLRRISADETPLPEDFQLAERIGFELEGASRPFVLASPRRAAQYHAELAARLRRRAVLAASEGRRVVGLSRTRSPWVGLELDPSTVTAQGSRAIRSERGRTLEDLRMAVEAASVRGDTGEITLEHFLPQLMLRRSPRTAGQIRDRVYGPLTPELAHTLDLLIEHDFERASTAAALPVHRNTLRDRINHISELTGVNLDRAEGRGLAWLAWLSRR